MKTTIKGKIINVLKHKLSDPRKLLEKPTIIVELNKNQLNARFTRSGIDGKGNAYGEPKDTEEMIGKEVYVRFDKNKEDE